MTTLGQIKQSFFPTDIYAEIVWVDNGKDTKAGKVYTVHIRDETEIMKLAVWDESLVKTLKQGQRVNITKANVSMFMNEVQLSLAKDGMIQIMSEPKVN